MSWKNGKISHCDLRFNVILIKITMIFFFAENENYVLKFIWSLKKDQIAKKKKNLENKVGGLRILNLKYITNLQ